MSGRNKPSRRKLTQDDGYDGANFEDIEISEYNNLGEYKSCTSSMWDSIKSCFGCGTGQYGYEDLKYESKSDTDSYRHEIDIPVPNRRSSSQPEDDTDDAFPAIDSTREYISEEEDDEEEIVEKVEQKPLVTIQLSSSSSESSASSDDKSSSEEPEEEDVQDFSNMFCLKNIKPKEISTFMLFVSKQTHLLKQIRSQYAMTLRRAKSSPESNISVYNTENRIMIIDRLSAWYKKIVTQLEKFMNTAKKYSDWNSVYLTHSPDLFIEFVRSFILEKRDTIFLEQKEPHDLPVLPDLPQFLA